MFNNNSQRDRLCPIFCFDIYDNNFNMIFFYLINSFFFSKSLVKITKDYQMTISIT